MHQDGRLGGGEGGREARQHQGGVGRLDLQPHQRLGGSQDGEPVRRYVRRHDEPREHPHRTKMTKAGYSLGALLAVGLLMLTMPVVEARPGPFNVTDNTTNDYTPSYSPSGKRI